jgi:hypothetical protein
MKGYTWFILFFILGFLVLYPIIFYKPSFSLWPSFVIKETALEHILQKKSIVNITKKTFSELKILIIILKEFSDFLKNTLRLIPTIGIITSEFFDISSFKFREFLVKAAVLVSWSNLASSWEKNSNYTFSFNCISLQEYTTPQELFKKLPNIVIDSSILACYFNLEYQESDYEPARLKVHPFTVYTKSKIFNANAQSKIEEFEVS